MEPKELKELVDDVPKSAVGLSDYELAENCYSKEDHIKAGGEELGDHLLVNYSADDDYDIACDVEHIHGNAVVAFGYLPKEHAKWLRKCAWCGDECPEQILMMLKLRKANL